jgi:hypothetical protein
MLFVCSQTDLSGVYYRGQSITFIYVVRRPLAGLLAAPLNYWIDFGEPGVARRSLNSTLRPLVTVVAVGLDCLSDSKRSVKDEINDRDGETDTLVGGTVTHRFVWSATHRVIIDAQ